MARRRKPEIDPMASEDEVRRMVPIEAIAHPNCPAALWWDLARQLPIEAMDSVLYSMMLLESPDRWAQMESDWIYDWIDKQTLRLPVVTQHLLAADCIERALPLLADSASGRGDQRPSEAVRVRRLFAMRKTSKQRWERVRQASRIAEDRGRSSFLLSVGALAGMETPWEAIMEAADVISSMKAKIGPLADILASDDGDVLWTKTKAEAKREELDWQWRRLQQYAKGEKIG